VRVLRRSTSSTPMRWAARTAVSTSPTDMPLLGSCLRGCFTLAVSGPPRSPNMTRLEQTSGGADRWQIAQLGQAPRGERLRWNPYGTRRRPEPRKWRLPALGGQRDAHEVAGEVDGQAL
jgi:hypothetical protein